MGLFETCIFSAVRNETDRDGTCYFRNQWHENVP